MSSAQSLRHFITERLTAAAEEIFAEFDKTIVRYEEELDRQRKLLEFCWNPQIKLQRIDLPQHRFWRNQEDLRDQQVYNQDNSGLHQEEPESFQTMESLEDLEPEQMQEKQDEQEFCHIKEEQEQQQLLQIKGEQEELFIGLEEEQLEMKQMTNNFMEIPSYEERVHREPDPDVDHLLVQTSSDADNQIQEEIDHYDTKSRKETQKNNGHQTISGQSDDVHSPSLTKQQKTNINRNLSSCNICGKSVVRGTLTDHIRTHTGEKPFICLTCGKRFSQKGTLFRHIKIHTGERSHSCSICGKSFIQRFNLTRHIRTHTRESPFSCLTCGKRFSDQLCFTYHMRSHGSDIERESDMWTRV
ncbi:PREDICTED: zinc finger protein OZF-like [Cyprinodon variegatus]|uniref:zinc finger protein OZF-like n=1 Tax=Cyprinodon variegatus TaxID=28743 RepID=UPI00074252B9|nr:PREDICTED: zinc finger protein OZF-like [Cyprinodon variegatus]